MVLVAIGESVVAVGIGANRHGVDAGTLITIALGVVISAGLWWAYFGEHDDQLREQGFVAAIAGGQRLVAVRAFGLVFVALLGGVVAVAAGLEHAIAHPGHTVSAAQALYLGGGVALFVLADQVSRHAMMLGLRRSRLLIAAAAVATAVVGVAVAGGAQEALLAAVLVGGLWLEGRPDGFAWGHTGVRLQPDACIPTVFAGGYPGVRLQPDPQCAGRPPGERGRAEPTRPSPTPPGVGRPDPSAPAAAPGRRSSRAAARPHARDAASVPPRCRLRW